MPNPNDDMNRAIAELLFPSAEDCSDIELRFPKRKLPDGAAVTRLGPSPTGFIHLGNLFMAFVNMRISAQTGGVFFLRIEDTDRKREVPGAVELLLETLGEFDVFFDEGVCAAGGKSVGTNDGLANTVSGAGAISERGDYGPYYQSERRNIYQSFAKSLVLRGLAYPCFLTEDEIAEIRTRQEAEKLLPGIYGGFSKWRGASADDVRAKLEQGEFWTLRMDATAASTGQPVTIQDGIRGEITFPENILDFVILKTDGLPTYHFAHVIDDHLMRTTHVIRGEEWLSSLPIHLMLFSALGFEPPVYCHTALMMKTDEDGHKRKLSKRKDPEFALSYYRALGFHPKAIEEYLLTVINSDYEEWRIANPYADNREFTIRTEKMGVAGVLFDLDKLRDVSKDTMLKIAADDIADFLIDWAKREAPEAAQVFERDKDILQKALDLGRTGDKPRKDLVCARQIFEFTEYFFDEFFEVKDALPDNIPAAEAGNILEHYQQSYDHAADRNVWFENIRDIAERLGYAPRPKDYKNNPEAYKGHVGDVSTVIRLAITGRANSPDIWEIQQILGEARVRSRIEAGIKYYYS